VELFYAACDAPRFLQRHNHSHHENLRAGFGFGPGPLCLSPAWSVPALHYFVLTDTNRALFCKQRDWSNPKNENLVRAWPATDVTARFYVGFNDGWAQGGFNTEGLAYMGEWDTPKTWEPDPHLPLRPGEIRAGGNARKRAAPSKDRPSLSIGVIMSRDYRRSKILVAGPDGSLGDHRPERMASCRLSRKTSAGGFGFGRRTA